MNNMMPIGAMGEVSLNAEEVAQACENVKAAFACFVPESTQITVKLKSGEWQGEPAVTVAIFPDFEAEQLILDQKNFSDALINTGKALRLALTEANQKKVYHLFPYGVKLDGETKAQPNTFMLNPCDISDLALLTQAEIKAQAERANFNILAGEPWKDPAAAIATPAPIITGPNRQRLIAEVPCSPEKDI